MSWSGESTIFLLVGWYFLFFWYLVLFGGRFSDSGNNASTALILLSLIGATGVVLVSLAFVDL